MRLTYIGIVHLSNFHSLGYISLFLVVTGFTGNKNEHGRFFSPRNDKCNCSTEKSFPAEGTNHEDCGLSFCTCIFPPFKSKPCIQTGSCCTLQVSTLQFPWLCDLQSWGKNCPFKFILTFHFKFLNLKNIMHLPHQDNMFIASLASRNSLT